MSEVREIVTRAVVAKGKKILEFNRKRTRQQSCLFNFMEESQNKFL